eukprot:3136277-Pleurochrysis_carterae.AAC.1
MSKIEGRGRKSCILKKPGRSHVDKSVQSDSWRCSKRRVQSVQAGVQAGGVQTWRAAPTLTLCARSDGSVAPADAAPQRINIKGCRNRISSIPMAVMRWL